MAVSTATERALQGDVVQVALGIGAGQVDGGWNAAFQDSLGAYHGFKRSGAGKHVTRARFG